MPRSREVSNSDDVIDSRDVIARIDELEGMIEDNKEADEKDREDLSEEEDELKALKAMAEEGEGYGEWNDGETLIRESYWVEYVEELLKDIGDLPKDIPWYIVIDWEATAENIGQDYTTLDFDGVTYYMRA